MEVLLKNQKEPETRAMGGKYLIFTLADCSYGISILSVNEIIGLLDITPIPKSPRFLKGIVNLRGKVIPVVDLRLKLEMQEKHYDERTCIIIVNADERQNEQVGLIVDMVSEVFYVPDSNIEPPFENNLNEAPNLMDGIAQIKDKMIVLLNSSLIIKF